MPKRKDAPNNRKEMIHLTKRNENFIMTDMMMRIMTTLLRMVKSFSIVMRLIHS